MSISSTVKKFMPYLKTAKDYVLYRLSSQAVEMDDGTTLEQKVTSLNSLISKKLNSANVVNNLTTTNSGYALDARQGKALNDSITSLNSALTVGAASRNGDANMMPGDPDHVNFFMVSGGSATLENHFPLDGASGCLLVINLYGQHLVQVFFTTNARVFVRAIASYNTGTSSFTEWKEIS